MVRHSPAVRRRPHVVTPGRSEERVRAVTRRTALGHMPYPTLANTTSPAAPPRVGDVHRQRGPRTPVGSLFSCSQRHPIVVCLCAPAWLPAGSTPHRTVPPPAPVQCPSVCRRVPYRHSRPSFGELLVRVASHRAPPSNTPVHGPACRASHAGALVALWVGGAAPRAHTRGSQREPTVASPLGTRNREHGSPAGFRDGARVFMFAPTPSFAPPAQLRSAPCAVWKQRSARVIQ